MLNITEDTLTTIEAAEMIGCSPSTLNSWRSRGKGPKFIRIAGRIRYIKTDLAAWINDQINAA